MTSEEFEVLLFVRKLPRQTTRESHAGNVGIKASDTSFKVTYEGYREVEVFA